MNWATREGWYGVDVAVFDILQKEFDDAVGADNYKFIRAVHETVERNLVSEFTL